MTIFLWAACMSSGAVAMYWGAVIYHVVRTWMRIPTARAGLETPLAEGEWPSVCVIVPAHNEEACIAGVARSLVGQEYPAGRLSMVFSLDRCTDGTERVLREALGEAVGGAAEIIGIDACPAGWAGKVNALWTAVNASPAARGAEVLLFVDADTTLDPRCVRACLGLMRQRGLEMLSLLSTLTRDRWFEVVAQPVAGMELVRMYPITRTNHPNQERPFANGQFIMIRREAYERFEGHKAVHWAVLEDVELARAADRAGVPLGVFLADGLLHCRMYSSWAEFRRGWKRIFTESANRKQSRLRGIAWRLRTLGIALPGMAAMGAAAGLGMRVSGNGGGVADWALGLGIAATLVFTGALWACASLGNTPRRGVPAFPAGAWLVSGVLLEAARDLRAGTPTEWGGMTYSRDAR